MSEKHWSDRFGFKFPHCVTSGGRREQRETEGKHSRSLSAARAAVFALSTACLSSACAVHQTLPLPPPGTKNNVVAPGSKANSSELSRTVVTPHSAADIQELFAKATADGEAKRYEASARGFERTFQLDPDGPLADRSLFESAEMYDLAGKHEEALARYEQVARRFPKSSLDRTTRVRALRLLTYLERYPRAGELAESTAAKYADLVSFDQLAVLAARALSRIAADDDAQAEIAISKARDIIEAENLDAAGRVPAELAPVYFALGELRRVRAERIHFVPVPTNFGAVLEQRCQLLLDAQSAYSDAMRAYDSHWSAMAGYRVGELYQKLHEEMMQVPPPKSADTQSKRELFEGAMRLRYSILLEKAKSMLDHTVAMAERTGEQSPWVLKSRQARDAISKAMADEQAALARLPYTKAQLQTALDSFAGPPAPAPAPAKAAPAKKAPPVKRGVPDDCSGGSSYPCR
jgi:tetratricopeptide (TPR) repeat protein